MASLHLASLRLGDCRDFAGRLGEPADRGTLADVSRRVNLPLASPDSESPPKVDAARQRLGGRAPSEGPLGQVVCASGSGEPGVVLWQDAASCHVYLGAGRIRRAPRDQISEFDGQLPPLVAQARDDVLRFAELREGDSVQYDDPKQGPSAGQLIEKCRWGALVLRSDERIMAIGFRNLRPVS